MVLSLIFFISNYLLHVHNIFINRLENLTNKAVFEIKVRFKVSFCNTLRFTFRGEGSGWRRRGAWYTSCFCGRRPDSLCGMRENVAEKRDEEAYDETRGG